MCTKIDLGKEAILAGSKIEVIVTLCKEKVKLFSGDFVATDSNGKETLKAKEVTEKRAKNKKKSYARIRLDVETYMTSYSIFSKGTEKMCLISLCKNRGGSEKFEESINKIPEFLNIATLFGELNSGGMEGVCVHLGKAIRSLEKVIIHGIKKKMPLNVKEISNIEIVVLSPGKDDSEFLFSGKYKDTERYETGRKIFSVDGENNLCSIYLYPIPSGKPLTNGQHLKCRISGAAEMLMFSKPEDQEKLLGLFKKCMGRLQDIKKVKHSKKKE